ncbi:uncharacterized protein TNCV_3318691 [Trichonephila clavipes]|nr:uncharacterized protein TNCV_3318691 [Trichonephila clavipes]
MDEQLKALLEGINDLKSGQEEIKERMENMQKSQEETKNELKEKMEKSQKETKERMEKGPKEMEKRQKEMQKGLDDTKNELKERMEKGQEETKQEMQKSFEEKIQKKVWEERIKEQGEEKIKEKVEEKIEEFAGNFTQRFEYLEKKLLACGNTKNESKIVYVSSVTMPASPVPLNASPVFVKLSTYDENPTGRGEAAEILQTLPDTERLNVNSLYNALDFRFGQKYSKEYAHLQMKTRLQKTGESLREYASKVERLANWAFSEHPATAATQASRRDRQSIRGARVTLDSPCESPWISDIEKLRDESQAFKDQRQNQEKRNFKCWGCGRTGHLRRNCPRSRKDENIVSSSKQEN